MSTLVTTDPRHGTVAGRVAGCDCFHCRAAVSRWRTNRAHHIKQGTWQPWADAEPVRQHLKTLSDYGIGWEQVVALTGLPSANVSRILYRSGDRPPLTRISTKTADRILAVQPCFDNLADSAIVDHIGAVRRLRALVAIGWPMATLGGMLPVHPHTVRLLARNGGSCTVKLVRAVIDLYSRMCMTLPPPTMATRRARNMAAQWGWAPPLAWDDDTIDDPDAEPVTADPAAGRADEHADEVLVGRAIAGRARWSELNHAERVLAVTRMRAAGVGVPRMADLLRMSRQNLGNWCRNVLDAPPTPEVPVAPVERVRPERPRRAEVQFGWRSPNQTNPDMVRRLFAAARTYMAGGGRSSVVDRFGVNRAKLAITVAVLREAPEVAADVEAGWVPLDQAWRHVRALRAWVGSAVEVSVREVA